MREKFWELDLDELTREEWEALCDGCGRCCLHKLEDEDSGAIEHTNIACRLLDPATARCTNYRHRLIHVPDCTRLTLRLVREARWLPESCAYRRRAEGKPLKPWHYLICGDREAVIRAGVSVAGRVIGEDEAGPVEHHIVEWPE